VPYGPHLTTAAPAGATHLAPGLRILSLAALLAGRRAALALLSAPLALALAPAAAAGLLQLQLGRVAPVRYRLYDSGMSAGRQAVAAGYVRREGMWQVGLGLPHRGDGRQAGLPARMRVDR
jgi:hypothetical protein